MAAVYKPAMLAPKELNTIYLLEVLVSHHAMLFAIKGIEYKSIVLSSCGSARLRASIDGILTAKSKYIKDRRCPPLTAKRYPFAPSRKWNTKIKLNVASPMAFITPLIEKTFVAPQPLAKFAKSIRNE